MKHGYLMVSVILAATLGCARESERTSVHDHHADQSAGQPEQETPKSKQETPKAKQDTPEAKQHAPEAKQHAPEAKQHAAEAKQHAAEAEQDAAEWKEETITRRGPRGVATVLSFGYPANWTVAKDVIFGRVVLTDGEDAEFIHVSTNLSFVAAWIRGTARETVTIVHEALQKKGYKLQILAEEFSDPVTTGGTTLAPPMVHTVGRRELVGVRNGNRYRILIETQVCYGDESKPPWQQFANATLYVDGHVNVSICPENLYDPHYRDIFSRISTSFQSQLVGPKSPTGVGQGAIGNDRGQSAVSR